MSRRSQRSVLVAVAAGGALGGPARDAVAQLVHVAPGPFPSATFSRGTFVINVTGSLVLGFITGLALYHGLDDDVRVVAGTGFCGAYTTFSAFSLETVRMIERGAYGAALRYSVATLFVAVAAAAVGLAVAAL